MRTVRELWASLTRFRLDRRGVAAVEFALIAPVLILTYFGLAELSLAMTAQRRVSHATSAIGDLVAQSDAALTPAAMDDIFAAATTIISPFSTSPLTLRVTSVTGDATGTPKVDWSRVSGTGLVKLTVNDTATLPTGLVTAQGDNVIMSEAIYTYTSPVSYVLKNGLNFSEKFYLRPRQLAKVGCTGC